MPTLGALFTTASDATDRRAILDKSCELDPTSCIGLGGMLAGLGDKEAAAAAYERAFREGLDRVAVASRMLWLVEYYLDQSRNDDALAVGADAGEVGSASGLMALGIALERTGRLDDAEKVFRSREQRYDGGDGYLGRFYMRAARHPSGARYAEKARLAASRCAHLAAATPQATAKWHLGVNITNTTPVLERAGLRAGDRILAVDGTLVSDLEAYKCVLARSDGPDVRVHVRHTDGSVQETSAPLRRFQPGLGLR